MAKEEHEDKEHKGLAQRVRKMEAQVKALQATLAAVTFDATTNEVVITGANLRIVNGLGITDCTYAQGDPIPDCPNGLGNLIVGYNEPRILEENIRTGSHNIVVRVGHNFSQFGGLVVGHFNTISGAFAAVSGGGFNTASGTLASVSGGASTRPAAPSPQSAGGSSTRPAATPPRSAGDTPTRLAAGHPQSAGGGFNTASGDSAVVSGGHTNTASGIFASVSGGNGITQATDSGWSAGSFGDTVEGSFRSPN